MARETGSLPLPAMQIPTVDVFGVPVANLTLDSMLERVKSIILARASPPFRITYVNAHSYNLFWEDDYFRRALLQADLIYADGNGPRLAARLLGKTLPERMTGADWIYDLSGLCSREDFSLALLGAKPGVAEAAADMLRRILPSLRVQAVGHGYPTPEEEADALARIDRLAPDILLIGMGSPRQEAWMARYGPTVAARVIWCVGGAFDYASGHVRRPPLWMRQIGLEWLGRMLIEPRRLGPRYLRGLPLFAGRALRGALMALAKTPRPEDDGV